MPSTSVKSQSNTIAKKPAKIKSTKIKRVLSKAPDTGHLRSTVLLKFKLESKYKFDRALEIPGAMACSDRLCVLIPIPCYTFNGLSFHRDYSSEDFQDGIQPKEWAISHCAIGIQICSMNRFGRYGLKKKDLWKVFREMTIDRNWEDISDAHCYEALKACYMRLVDKYDRMIQC